MSKCLLCSGTGKLDYKSPTEISDNWLAELKEFCQDKKNAKRPCVPGEYVVRLVNEIWQLTYVALAQGKEIVELRVK